MAKEKTTEAEISGYISSMLRDHFGKGPASVYVTLQPPFLVIYFRGFTAPMEQILLKQKESKRILETREIMMSDLKEEMKEEFRKIGGLNVQELYADWNLGAETGVIVGIMENGESEENFSWPTELNKKTFMELVVKASEEAQKVPDKTEAYWLNERTIFVRRSGILVRIEKALIENGMSKELKTAKRPLERKIIQEVGMEKAVHRKIVDYFVDWNFQKDEGYIVLVLEGPAKEK